MRLTSGELPLHTMRDELVGTNVPLAPRHSFSSGMLNGLGFCAKTVAAHSVDIDSDNALSSLFILFRFCWLVDCGRAPCLLPRGAWHEATAREWQQIYKKKHDTGALTAMKNAPCVRKKFSVARMGLTIGGFDTLKDNVWKNLIGRKNPSSSEKSEIENGRGQKCLAAVDLPTFRVAVFGVIAPKVLVLGRGAAARVAEVPLLHRQTNTFTVPN